MAAPRSEHLSDDERAYQVNLIENLKAAQSAWQSWSAWLAAKYRLGPNDTITAQGEVIRGDRPDSE